MSCLFVIEYIRVSSTLKLENIIIANGFYIQYYISFEKGGLEAEREKDREKKERKRNEKILKIWNIFWYWNCFFYAIFLIFRKYLFLLPCGAFACNIYAIFPFFSHFSSGSIECKEPIEVVSYKIGVCKVSPKGKDCSTIFQKLGFNGKTSVVLCKPRTGRMHQIRVHLQFLGKFENRQQISQKI